MTPLEAAQARHHRNSYGLCASCLLSWPCDYQLQRDEAFRLRAEVERLAEAVETEWYNGNMDEGARDRILAGVET